jgi:hypothetical protein
MLEFDESSRSLESAEGPGKVKGKQKLMGFEGGEIRHATNP